MATPAKAVPPEIIDALADVNAATNEVATTVTALREQVKAGMSQADADTVKAALTDIASRLRGIAAPTA